MWRLKYMSRDSLASASGAKWADSPLLQAFGHAVTIAEFETDADAKGVLARVGSGDRAYPKDEAGYGAGKVRFRSVGRYFLMSSLPEKEGR